MILTIKKKVKVNNILLTLLVWSIALFAYDKYNIKTSLLCITLLYNFKTIIYHIINFKKNKIIFVFGILFPLYLCFSSVVFCGGSIMKSVSSAYVCVYLLLVFVLEDSDFDICRALHQIMSFLAVLIVIIGLLDFTEIVDLYGNGLCAFIRNLNEGVFYKNSNAIFYYVLFLKTSHLFVFDFIYTLVHKKYIWSFITLIALIWSGTRANIYITVIMLVVYLFFIIKSNVKKVMFSLVSILLCYVGYNTTVDKIEIINNAKSNGDEVRRLIVPSIINALNEKKIRWLVGMGNGSTYYSIGRGFMVDGEEIAYLEFLRLYGSLGFVFLLSFLMIPIKKIFFSEYRWVLLPYFSFLIISAVDPFLFTSTSFVIYVIVYDIYVNKLSKKK